IQHNLEHLTLNVHHTELEELVADIGKIYLDDLMKEDAEIRKSAKESVIEFVLSQRIADCVDYYYDRDPKRVRDFQEKISRYERKLRRLHLKDSMLREKTTLAQLLKPDLATFGKAIFGFPLAAYGIVNNYLPYRATERIARKFITERTKILTALFLGGFAFFALFYSLQFVLVWQLTRVFWAALYLVSLPVSGFFALAYLREMRRQRERISFSFFLFTNRHLLSKMRRARKKLIAELDTVKAEYLEAMKSQEPSETTAE
ncbi:MAG: hypothetical protein AB1715_01445, partial [Acidobacteriota bacterium]